MLRPRHHHSLLHFTRLLSTAATDITSPSLLVDLDHLSATIRSPDPSLLPASYAVTPPIYPWPSPLLPRRLALMIRRQDDIQLALRIFHHAASFVPGFRHNYLTYHTLLHKLALARAFPELESVLSHLSSASPPVRCGEEAFVTAIRAYGMAGKPSAALRVFLSIRPRFGVNTSVRSFNALLNAMVQCRRFDAVGVLFKNCRGRFGIRPNVFTCNILVKSLCKMYDLGGARKVLEEMPSWGMVPNLVTYTTILAGYCDRGDMDSARGLFDEIVDQGFHPDATTYTVLINGYCRLGRLVDAARIMDEMEADKVPPNDITFSVMIEACCKEKKAGEALNLLHDMLEGECMPSSALCCRVIDLLCKDGMAAEACGAWRKMLDKNCMPDNSILSTLVYWLCKGGKVKEAMALYTEFKKAFAPSLLTYNTLISGMCDNGELQGAAMVWDDMSEKRSFPNAFTYNVLIRGFCKAGKVKEGVRIFEEMRRKGYATDKLTNKALMDGLCQSGAKEHNKEVQALESNGAGMFLDEECWNMFVKEVVTETRSSESAIEFVQRT